MRKRILALLLALALLGAMIPAAFAEGETGSGEETEETTQPTDLSEPEEPTESSEPTEPEEPENPEPTEPVMEDIQTHWAKGNILWSMEQGLFKGVTETTFEPNGSMTRAMFVTVLGRFAGVTEVDFDAQQAAGLYTDVQPERYYAPYILWATRYGIANGMGDGSFAPNDPITREQMATFMVRFAQIYNYDLTAITEDIVAAFADEDLVGNYAKAAVETMRFTGLVNGVKEADGTYRFNPKANATRAECATVFRRLTQSLQYREDQLLVMPTEINIGDAGLTLYLGESYALSYTIAPANATNQTVTWLSSDPTVVTVDNGGILTCAAAGTAEILAYTCNGFYDVCTVTVTEGYIGCADESYFSKCMNIFGEYTTDPRHYYSSAEEVKAHLVTVKVQVWDFADSTRTTKITKTLSVTVHENIALTVEKIFAEIYACEAQYPINYIGGYRWANNSEHTPGLAIDVNANENPYVSKTGVVLVGSHFDPENDEYSMPIDGEVQQIFEKYGFTRGIYWNSGNKDYMHYSFFGT